MERLAAAALILFSSPSSSSASSRLSTLVIVEAESYKADGSSRYRIVYPCLLQLFPQGRI